MKTDATESFGAAAKANRLPVYDDEIQHITNDREEIVCCLQMDGGLPCFIYSN